MHATLDIQGKNYRVDFSQRHDFTIPIGRRQGPSAFYLGAAQYRTVEAGGFVGDTQRGGSCNCEDIIFNPHGNGTHTEGAGHVAALPLYPYRILRQRLFPALLTSVRVEGGVVPASTLEKALEAAPYKPQALLVRTLPNEEYKKTAQWSGANPPYFSPECMDVLNIHGVLHLLTDLPSLDREDDPNLTAHKRFFGHPEEWNHEKTVTEMIFVPDAMEDGILLLELQVAAFESDASVGSVGGYDLIKN